MKNIFLRVPLPLSGVMLAIFALGNLLQSYDECLRYLCGFLGVFLLFLLLGKILFFPEEVAGDFKNPILASVAGTFPMGLMLFSTYLKPIAAIAAYGIWWIGVVLHIALIVYFTRRFIFYLEWNKVFASYFIVYVGIAAAAVTAPIFKEQYVGRVAFIFAFISLGLLLFVVTYRYAKYRAVPEPAKALLCIYGAPAALCLTAYLKCIEPKNMFFVQVMYLVTTALGVVALVQAIYCLKFKFYPSMAAFTFPLVITAMASKMAIGYMLKNGVELIVLPKLIFPMVILASIVVFYVYAKFMHNIFFSRVE